MLAASPDRIVNSGKIVEVKCPFSAKNKPINPVNVPYLKMNNGQLMLDKKHNYYYQIQGQLYCADRQTCDLVIFTVTDMKIIPVVRDSDFIANMVSKLITFYQENFCDVLIKVKLYKQYDEFTF